jgi:hypothetical protein
MKEGAGQNTPSPSRDGPAELAAGVGSPAEEYGDRGFGRCGRLRLRRAAEGTSGKCSKSERTPLCINQPPEIVPTGTVR